MARPLNTPRAARRVTQKASFAAAIAATLTLAASAQTRIEPDKNSYSPEQDVQLGQQAAAEVRQQLPLVEDRVTEQAVEDIGRRLVNEIPDYLQQPAFRYTFDVVNLKEINAFALPGGPMFLHRGMLEAANTDGEVAGVMAHELSHVILRHGTAQATKGQKFQIGAIAGQVLGAIVGGRAGSAISQGSQLGLGVYFLKYGREYEREADLLGAQIMARAGYDPRQMANMFRTIQQQGGSSGPEWLSDHPDPGNRYEAILREAETLRVEGSAPQGRLEQVQARLAQLPPAPTSEQVARARQQGRQPAPVGTTGRTARVERPSGNWQTVEPAGFIRLQVPSNWRQMNNGGGTVMYAPQGGVVQSQSGQSAFTHGLELGVMQADGGSLQRNTDQLVQMFARANPDLRKQSGYSRTTIDGRQALTTTLSNVSEVTGQREAINLSTVQLSDGSVLFLLGVAPSDEAQTYFNTFGRVRQSVQLNDQAPR
jgi:Zn-dependent protease with chaperone function